jgi:hypothetical protein
MIHPWAITNYQVVQVIRNYFVRVQHIYIMPTNISLKYEGNDSNFAEDIH